MQLQIMSDLHTEFYDDPITFVEQFQPEAENLVLAGDIGYLSRFAQLVRVLAIFCERWKRVIYIPGNHEFWGGSVHYGLSALDQLTFMPELSNLTWLHDGIGIVIDGKEIIGDTMWFQDDPLNTMYQGNMPDFDKIDGFVPWVYDHNAAWQKFLEKRPADVVVTHHMPVPECTPTMFRDSQLNRFFVCNMGKYIDRFQPALWICGHTHTPCDFVLGKTRIVCNPSGYPREDTDFNPSLVIEVP